MTAFESTLKEQMRETRQVGAGNARPPRSVRRSVVVDSDGARATDASLVEAALAGDAEPLVRRYWPEAYRVARLLSHDPTVAEDLAQEALLSALGALESFDRERGLGPWVRRIAANKTLDWLRQRKPELTTGDLELIDASSEDTLIDEITAQTLPNELFDAVGALPIEFRTAVVLRHLLDYQPVEISKLLEVPPETVRTRLHRGLERLRAELTDQRRSHEQAR